MAAHHDAVSLVYARSLFELAESAGGRDKILEVAGELEQIAELMRGDRQFAELLGSPIVESAQRRDSLRRIFADRITDLLLRFLLVLNDKGRLGRLASIAEAYDYLVQEAFGRVEVDVFTPQPLGDDARASLRDRIQAALGKEPVLHAYTDPAMLGGIRLRIGDQLIDASVASRLRRLRQNVMVGGQSALRGRLDELVDGGDTP